MNGTAAALFLGRDDGHSPRQIAAILRISESSVYDYQREYDVEQKTINDPHPGKSSKLTSDQEAEEAFESNNIPQSEQNLSLCPRCISSKIHCGWYDKLVEKT